MAALISVQHVAVHLVLVWIQFSLATENYEVKPRPGQDVTLQCHTSTDDAITLLLWSRPERKNDYVFFFRKNRPYESFQNPRYQGRVELKDPEMKNGDASVVLKNVSVNDTGTYKCQVTSYDVVKQVASVHLLVSEEVKAGSGEDVTLPCNSYTDAAIIKLKWKRPELKHYVFFFKDNRLYENYQDPRYRGRVELSDPEMKNGDFSVVLKNVSINDTGMYECLVITPSNNRRRRDVGNRVFRGSVHLFVSEGSEKEINDEQPGGPGGYVWWRAVLGVGLGLVVLIVGAQFCCKMYLL